MSDFETLKAMFDRAGVVYSEDDENHFTSLTITVNIDDEPRVNDGKLEYSVCSVFYFDEVGRLFSITSWE